MERFINKIPDARFDYLMRLYGEKIVLYGGVREKEREGERDCLFVYDIDDNEWESQEVENKADSIGKVESSVQYCDNKFLFTTTENCVYMLDIEGKRVDSLSIEHNGKEIKSGKLTLIRDLEPLVLCIDKTFICLYEVVNENDKAEDKERLRELENAIEEEIERKAVLERTLQQTLQEKNMIKQKNEKTREEHINKQKQLSESNRVIFQQIEEKLAKIKNEELKNEIKKEKLILLKESFKRTFKRINMINECFEEQLHSNTHTIDYNILSKIGNSIASIDSIRESFLNKVIATKKHFHDADNTQHNLTTKLDNLRIQITKDYPIFDEMYNT